MIAWFRTLQRREQIILSAGCVIAVIILSWEFAWIPVVSGTADLRESVAAKEQLLADLQRAAVAGGAAQGGPASAPSQSLVLLISQTSESANLASAITRFRPDGTNAINVSVQNAAFAQLMGWLISLQQDHGVVVENASINGTRDSGRVSGQLYLRRN